jgi:hypothetical protein
LHPIISSGVAGVIWKAGLSGIVQLSDKWKAILVSKCVPVIFF